jgi:transcriptional regulator with XRE-family HTH domain
MPHKTSPTSELLLPSSLVIGNISKMRAKNGFKQEYMAHKLGLTLRAYQNIKQGKNKSITVDMVSKIAEVLEADWLELLKEEKAPVTQITNIGDNLNHSQKQYTNEAIAAENTFLKKELASLEVRLKDKDETIAALKELLGELREQLLKK